MSLGMPSPTLKLGPDEPSSTPLHAPYPRQICSPSFPVEQFLSRPPAASSDPCPSSAPITAWTRGWNVLEALLRPVPAPPVLSFPIHNILQVRASLPPAHPLRRPPPNPGAQAPSLSSLGPRRPAYEKPTSPLFLRLNNGGKLSFSMMEMELAAAGGYFFPPTSTPNPSQFFQLCPLPLRYWANI